METPLAIDKARIEIHLVVFQYADARQPYPADFTRAFVAPRAIVPVEIGDGVHR
jgi:hypothetical protein